jgi:hypothetical protein
MSMFMKTKYFEGSFWCSNAEGVAKILDAQKETFGIDQRGDEKLGSEEEKDVEKDRKTPSRL